eukprot:15471525-Alexandrium_andersonii.AAC.2
MGVLPRARGVELPSLSCRASEFPGRQNRRAGAQLPSPTLARQPAGCVYTSPARPRERRRRRSCTPSAGSSTNRSRASTVSSLSQHQRRLQLAL